MLTAATQHLQNSTWISVWSIGNYSWVKVNIKPAIGHKHLGENMEELSTNTEGAPCTVDAFVSKVEPVEPYASGIGN